MSDVPGGELKFGDRAELEVWLRSQPPEVSVVIAARAAVRILPTLHRWAGALKAREFSELAFASFRGAAVAWVAAKYPARADEIRIADLAPPATAAAYAAVPPKGIASPAVIAAHAALAASSPGSAAWAAGNAVYAAASAASPPTDIWAAVSADANRLKTVSPSDLASEALWLGVGPPLWASGGSRQLQVALREPHWAPWLEWYQRRLDGIELSEETEILFATRLFDPREKDPSEQNVALAKEIERLKGSELSEVSRGELNFQDRDELEVWLGTQPREVSVVIAARAALRISPLLHFEVGRLESRRFAELVFASFWATALARVAAKYPTRADELLARAGDAANAAAEAPANANAAAATTRAARAVTRAADAVAYAAVAASAAAASARADLLAAVTADANRLKVVSPSDLASEALWPQGVPQWALAAFSELLGALSAPHWKPWLDWFERRRNGYEDQEEIEALFATVPCNPRDKDPAEQNAALSAEIERLRKLDANRINPAIAQAVERIIHDPQGASVSIVEGQARIVGAASEGDLAAAQDPQTRQLHERTKVRAAAALAQAKRLHNQGGFGNIAETIGEFAKWIDGDTESLAENISTVWELAVAIGTFIDRDDKAGSTPGDLTPKMDAAARESLDQLVICAAPFVRRFPTALANDEAYRQFKRSKEPVAPSKRIVLAGKDAKLIERDSGEVLEIALEASEREGPQAEKSRVWGLSTVTKLVFVMFVCVAPLGAEFAGGVAHKAGEKFGKKSQFVGRMVDYLLRVEDDILKSLDGLPPDVPAAAREFFRRLRTDHPPLPDPGEGP